MTLSEIIAVAVALAMDAFAVAVASAVSLKTLNKRQIFRLSWHFGLFQAIMPVIGWGAGLTFRSLIEKIDHWVAFFLLAYVGTNMMWEAFKKKNQDYNKKDPSKGLTLLMLAVATSIDALAIGLSISLLNISIWLPAGIIGLTAAMFTLLGIYLGTRAFHFSGLGKYAEIAGALVLYLIGLHILYDHLQPF